jgi:hypothetical protein
MPTARFWKGRLYLDACVKQAAGDCAMNDPQDMFNAWRAFMYIAYIPVIMLLLYYAINPKKLESGRHKSSRYRPSEYSYVFIRIVCIIFAILISALLVKISSL